MNPPQPQPRLPDWVACPDAEVCKHCPCAQDDDVCFPGERLRAENRRLREAVAAHARTLDDRALGLPEHVERDRDSIDNELYNAVRAVDPVWWDREVPGLNG